MLKNHTAPLQTRKITWQEGKTAFEGHLSMNAAKSAPLPVVLVIHDWSGCNAFARGKADEIAAMGYAGFAIDLYGEGKTGQTTEEKMALMKPLMADRALLLRRIQSAVDAVKTQPGINAKKIAVIGFCFGGLCALDLARSSREILGAVSLHGLLTPPPQEKQKTLTPLPAKILVLHGHDDPMVPPDQLLAFEQEMTAAKADWQVLVFGGTRHAFTNPEANDAAMGTVYNATAARRAWIATGNFLSEVFGQ